MTFQVDTYGFGWFFSSLLFAILGFMVWALMQSVGEVTTMFPIAGGFIEVCSNDRAPMSKCRKMSVGPLTKLILFSTACHSFRRPGLQLRFGVDILFHVERVSRER